MSELLNSTTGTLSLVHYPSNDYTVDWKPSDHFLITDADSQEQGEWSLVDKVSKRGRTPSECQIFNTNTSNNGDKDDERQQQNSPLQNEPKLLRVKLKELKHIDVIRNGLAVRLVQTNGKIHSEYLFQNGNADSFVRSLQSTRCLQRNRSNKNQFEIVQNIEYDKEKLQKTFAELKIEDIKGKGGWLSNIVRHPLEHTMDLFAKMSDVVTLMPGQSPHQSPKLETHPNSIGSVASNSDDYELLSTSPRPDVKITLSQAILSPTKELPIRPLAVRGLALTTKQWAEFLTEDGRVSDVERVKELIFHGGIEPSLRKDVWKYLLNYYDWNLTAEQCVQLKQRKSQEYFQMKLQWLSMSKAQEKNFSDYRDRKCQIEKDVKRTDRSQLYYAGENNPHLSTLQDILMTYVMYNFDLGYVQGMSDLLAPLLVTMNDEVYLINLFYYSDEIKTNIWLLVLLFFSQVDAFWCFVGFMDVVFSNFDMDQAGMKRQLLDLNKLIALANPRLYNHFKEHDSENMYFCFRWLLVWFKREFNHTDILELWEVLWTGLPCNNFHLFISVAILDDQMRIFIDNDYGFNDILKHVNELSLMIDVKSILEKAEAIYLQIKDAEQLTDDIRIIMGHEPLHKDDKVLEEDYDDNFDEIISVERNAKDEEQIQKKIDEACERSMYNSFY